MGLTLHDFGNSNPVMDQPRAPIFDSPADAFRFAVSCVGGQLKLAKLVGRTQSGISKRLAAGVPCWPEHVLAVEAATGVSRHDLRPDIYPRDLPPAPDTELYQTGAAA